VAVIGDNRRLLIFPLDEVPEMTRGRGDILQRYKDGGLADVKTFNMAEGLTWKTGERTRTETDLMAWQGKRAQSGALPPKDFPKATRSGKARPDRGRCSRREGQNVKTHSFGFRIIIDWHPRRL